ncbi:MAG: hypothetical protein HY660_18000 [Armatimonadetes bacterium]|nr:hypothetical protein [Armatimonadota bacterium]
MRVFVDCQGSFLYVKTDQPHQAGPLLRRLMTVRGWLPIASGEWQVPLLPQAFEAVMSGIEAVEGEMVLVPGMARRVQEWLNKREESMRPASGPSTAGGGPAAGAPAPRKPADGSGSGSTGDAGTVAANPAVASTSDTQ